MSRQDEEFKCAACDSTINATDTLTVSRSRDKIIGCPRCEQGLNLEAARAPQTPAPALEPIARYRGGSPSDDASPIRLALRRWLTTDKLVWLIALVALLFMVLQLGLLLGSRRQGPSAASHGALYGHVRHDLRDDA